MLDNCTPLKSFWRPHDTLILCTNEIRAKWTLQHLHSASLVLTKSVQTLHRPSMSLTFGNSQGFWITLGEISAARATKASDPEPFQLWAEVPLQFSCHKLRLPLLRSFPVQLWSHEWSPPFGIYFLCFDLLHLPVGLLPFFWWSDKAHLTWALHHSCLCPTPPLRALAPRASQYMRVNSQGKFPPLLLLAYFRLPASQLPKMFLVILLTYKHFDQFLYDHFLCAFVPFS